MTAKKKTSDEGPRYAEAMEELEGILEELEGEEIDVDELGSRVKRASELLRLCRSRLQDTRTEIEQVVADLEGFGQGDDGEDG